MKKPTESGQFKLDGRDAGDIRRKIASLAAAYTPEWHFDEKNPDIGSAIALLFAEQAEWNIQKFNRQMEQFRTDYVNMLGLSLRPARPAQACVLFSPVSDAFEGTYLKKGTKLSAVSDGKDMVFETSSGCYITDSRLTHGFQVQKGTGVTAPLFGDFLRQEYFEEDVKAGREDFSGAKLFFYPEKGIEKNGLVIAHEHIFDAENHKIYMKFIGRDNLARRIMNGEFKVLYPGENGLLEAEGMELLSDTLVISRKEPVSPVLIVEARKPQKTSVVLDDILVSSAGEAHPPAYAGNGISDADTKKFAPFGDTLQLFDECYIGDDRYFSKGNSLIRMRFQVSFPEHMVGLLPSGTDKELRLIKRKPPSQIAPQPAETKAEEIALEYFNGTGWKRLLCEQDCTGMLAAGRRGNYELRFICPHDWRPSMAGSYEGRCLRLRLMKADNCYLTPCSHTYPVIENLEIGYSYESKYERPKYLERLSGTGRRELTESFRKSKPVTAFLPPTYQEDALYLGLDKKPEAGPLSLYFEFEQGSGFGKMKLSFAYSGAHGFRRMKILDGTDGFSHTGIVCFMPPEDFAKTEQEGICRYWIRITDEGKGDFSETACRPQLNRVCVNAVSVSNIESREEEDFYMGQMRPNMSFALAEGNILDADIWVNERDACSQEQKEELLKETPKLVRAEYNLSGNIQDFYVKWQEVEDFGSSLPGDRHYVLDRTRNEVRFGDGVHVKIPTVTDSAAFTAAVRVCDGAAGNVEAGTITDFVSGSGFYGEVYNPFPAFGGTDQETKRAALLRGAGIMSSRRRLLTKQDYIREIKSYSENIDKAACIIGETPEGETSIEHVCLVVLMKDFAQGARSFAGEAAELKEYLYTRCEMTIERDKLSVVQPVPVEIGVELWVESFRQGDSFELQGRLTETLDRFLAPVSDGGHAGWEIGVLPEESQILMRLYAAVRGVRIKNILITGMYRGRDGVREMELERIPKSPFFICKSGRHRIHILT